MGSEKPRINILGFKHRSHSIGSATVAVRICNSRNQGAFEMHIPERSCWGSPPQGMPDGLAKPAPGDALASDSRGQQKTSLRTYSQSLDVPSKYSTHFGGGAASA